MITEMANGVTLEQKGKIYFMHADSVSALQEIADRVPHNGHNVRKWKEVGDRNASPIGSNEKWFGTNTAREAYAVLKAGTWEDGVRRMEEALAKITAPVPVSVRRALRWTDQGDELDIHRVYNGQLDTAWRRSGPRRRNGSRNVTIMANLSINANVHSEVLFWKGAAALRLADILTAAGYNVEIQAAFTTTHMDSGYHQDAVLTTVVKDARAPLDLNALAVTVAFGAFFRVTMFRALLQLPCEVNGGLGHSEPYRDVATLELDPRQMIVSDNVFNAKQANDWIAEQVAALEDGSLLAVA